MTLATADGGRPVEFFKRFVRSPRSVGALCPSSGRLARAMLRDVDISRCRSIVEYGPGTGSFTREIRDRLAGVDPTARARYLGIERESMFHEILEHRLPELDFALGSVEDVREHLDAVGQSAPDLIVSGLPLILMPTRVMDSIVRTAAEVVTPGGSFRTFSYLHSWPARSTRRLRGMMREYFDEFTMRGPIWWNCPPAFVLWGDKHLTESYRDRRKSLT